ncbi:MAG TPA: NUDIX domain-containing protein [Bacteroidetes bacterium]|nr:NUDIX domain-containing protein [Bacteroidota bacterium]
MMTGYYQIEGRHLVAVDCIIFGYDIRDKDLKLLLVKRNMDPGRGEWSLPGGFVKEGEGVFEAACRVLNQLTGLQNVYMEQSFAYGDVNRDPGGRVISVTYFALIKYLDIDPVKQKTSGAQWRSMKELPKLVFDHRKMVDRALRQLREKVKIKPVGFELLPEKFTLVHLQDLYEAIYQRKVDRRNFRKKIQSMNLLEKLDEKERETSKRGAFYYRFLPANYEEFTRQGFYFNLDVS